MTPPRAALTDDETGMAILPGLGSEIVEPSEEVSGERPAVEVAVAHLQVAGRPVPPSCVADVPSENGHAALRHPTDPVATASAAQRDAVLHGDGPCLVLAAPGSGKTWVITQRYSRLVHEGVPPERVLALTYNRRAAEEMLARVERQLGPLPGDPPLTTYNAWAAGLVRRFGWHLGWPETVRIATVAERWMYLAEAIAEVRPRALHNPARPYDAVRRIQRVIEKAKQELVTPEEYLAHAEAALADADASRRRELERHRDVAHVYGRLQQRFRAAGIVDHDDCIVVAADLLLRVDAVRQHCATLEHVMVDEFQDTNTAQATMVERLVATRPDGPNLLVVADDDQAIYKFRGASRANIRRFRAAFPERREITLQHNRRSTPEVIAAAQVVIDAAVTREPKTVLAVRESGEPVRIVAADHYRDEAAAIADSVAARLRQGAFARDIAVLVRNRSELDAVVDQLRAAEIPYVTSGGSDFFRAPEIKGVMALLEAIENPDECQAVMRCLHFPAWHVSSAGRYAASMARQRSDVSLHTLLQSGAVTDMDEPDRAAGRRMAEQLVELHDRTGVDDVRELFELGMEMTGYAGLAAFARDIERRQFSANLSRFFEILDEFCALSRSARLSDALEYLRLMREAGAEGTVPLDDDVDGVRLSTIHGAKGLEWSHVIVAACAQGKLPTRDMPDALVLPEGLAGAAGGDASGVHREEERRLLYVAMTRARDSLTITYAGRYRFTFESMREKPSEFLHSLLAAGDPIGAADEHSPLPHGTIELVRQQPTPLAPPRRRVLPEARGDGPLHLSYSSLAGFRACPRRYEYRAVWRLPELWAADSWFGILVHTVLRDAMRLRLDGRDVDSDAAVSLWESAWASAIGLRQRQQHLRTEGADMIRAYVGSDLWAAARPHLLEHPFGLDVSADVVVRGRFDRVDMVDGAPVIVDYKTGVPREPDGLRRDLQLRIYALAAAHQFATDQVRCEIHWLQSATASAVAFGPDDLDRAFRHVQKASAEVQQAHRSGIFVAKPSAWNCNRCGYRVICDEGRSGR